MTIRVAVVGVNNIGKRHCKVYKEHPDTELVAVCDLNEALARSVGDQFKAQVYTDLRTLLAQEQVDVVSVATGGVENGSHHYEPTMIAIEAGKDVLVEKPISNRLDEARTMVQAAQERGVRIACNLNHRFVPAAAKAKDMIAAGELGDILFFNMKLTIGNPRELGPWLHMRALHPHSIDVMHYLAGPIRRVQSFMLKAPGRDTWSTASINVEFASGAVGHLTGSYDMSMKHPIEYCEVAGNKGRLVIDNVYEQLTLYPHDREMLSVYRNPIFGTAGFDATFTNRLHAFISDIKAGVAPDAIRGSGAEALAAQQVIEAAIQSQEQGGAVVEVATVG
jgi:UDP-N-acetylglucosamine 3-dehydrogenase